MRTPTLILATGNLHKVEEFAKLFEDCDVTVVSANTCGGMPLVDEDGSTFAENAQIKANALHSVMPNDGAWVVADDSGLEVDGLNGAPGIYSARYAGTGAKDSDNLAKLLKALNDMPADLRRARFRCVLCVIDNKGSTAFYEGSCEGHIATEIYGEGGFGYDPVFIPDGYSQSFAQLGSELKNRISHRARAVQLMRRRLGW